MGYFACFIRFTTGNVQRYKGINVIAFTLGLMPSLASAERSPLPAEFCQWTMTNFEIDAPLCGLRGDADRGRAVAADRHGGNCLACHVMPIPEEPFHGTVGPPLSGVGGRYSEAQLRARVVDEQRINPSTIMPGFYRDPREVNRVAGDFWGETFLTAQQVEDVVAYLMTLK